MLERRAASARPSAYFLGTSMDQIAIIYSQIVPFCRWYRLATCNNGNPVRWHSFGRKRPWNVPNCFCAQQSRTATLAAVMFRSSNETVKSRATVSFPFSISTASRFPSLNGLAESSFSPLETGGGLGLGNEPTATHLPPAFSSISPEGETANNPFDCVPCLAHENVYYTPCISLG